MKKISIKLSTKKLVMYSYLLVFFIILISFIGTSFFLFNNFYQSLSQSEEVLNLSRKVAYESVNINQFEEIIAKLDNKVNTSTPPIISNPFN